MKYNSDIKSESTDTKDDVKSESNFEGEESRLSESWDKEYLRAAMGDTWPEETDEFHNIRFESYYTAACEPRHQAKTKKGLFSFLSRIKQSADSRDYQYVENYALYIPLPDATEVKTEGSVAGSSTVGWTVKKEEAKEEDEKKDVKQEYVNVKQESVLQSVEQEYVEQEYVKQEEMSGEASTRNTYDGSGHQWTRPSSPRIKKEPGLEGDEDDY